MRPAGPGPAALPGSAAGATARLAPVGVVAGLLATALVLGRRLWFFSDDWNIFAEYHAGNLLEPFNGHLSLVPAGTYQLLFHTVGVGSYLPYRLCGLAALCLLGFQVARFSHPRVGPWAGALAVAAVLWNSFGTTNVMFPFLMNFSLPLAALLAIWWHLDHGGAGEPGGGVPRRRLLAVGAWTAVALATSGLGVVAVAAVLAELLLRRAPWRTWAAVAVPVAAWLAWWLGHRDANDVSTDPGAVVPYAARMLWAGTTSIAAGSKPGGLVLAALLVALGAWATVRARRLDPRAAGALAAALAFAGLTALTRQDTVPPIPPDELRYGWTIGACVVLAAVAFLATLRAAPPARPAALVAGGLAAAVLFAGGVRLVGDMSDWADLVGDAAPGLRSNLHAVEAAGAERLDPATIIRPLSFVPVRAGDYLDGVASVGSPLQGSTPAEVGGTPDQRRSADELFFGAVDLELVTAPALAAERTCGDTAQALPGETVLVSLGVAAGQAALAEPAVEVSRYATEPAVALAVERVGVAHTLVLPEDAPVGTDAPVPYQLRGVGGVTVCVPVAR